MDFNVSSDWKQAINGEIIITNISEQTIEDWSLEFDFDKNISSFWTADIVSHEGNHYSIVNKGYNANIAPGASVSLGFRGEPGGVDNSPNNYILQKYHIADANQKAAAIHRKMAEEELANWVVPTLLELEGEFRSLYQTAQRFYREGLSFEREEQYKLAKDKYQLSWQTLYNKRKELNDINDIISYIMANPDDDHDGDGLLNGFETEAFYGCMNPMKADSDDNGINDGDEDYDLDGLSNLDEQKYGTSPIDSDTDNDGINDKREIELGLNPLDPNDNQTKKEQLIISNETGIEIKINAMGNAEDKVRVAESQTVVESVYAVSPFYDISTEIDFESAEIKIPIDLSSIPEEDYDKLWIVYFDEELGGFIPIENSTVDPENSCVSAVTNHFSLYSIFYIKNWDTYFSVPFNEAKRITEEHINLLDVMFIIDSSGSMDWNDPNDYRKQAAKNFVDALLPGDQIGLIVGDRAGVVDFDSYAYLLQGLTDDFEAVKDAIDDIDSSGGTNIGNGVNLANDELIAKSDEDRIKVEILLTDGEGSYSTSYTNEAIQNDITIYTIGLGNSVNSALLRQIAENTGGQYFHVNSADELPIVYDRIYEITTEPQDSDGDGIPDSLEIEGIKVGSILGRLIYTDPNNPDSDGDGLLDGEEIDVKNAHTVTILGIEFKWYKMLSDPNKMDTDNDNLNDYQETTEYKTNPMQKDSDNDKLDDYTEVVTVNSNPRKADTDNDTLSDYDEYHNEIYDPCTFDKVIKSNGKYIVNEDDRWYGRVHIQSPVIISHQASLEISDINKIFIENITKTTHWEDEIISVYGELLAVDESLKAIEYEGSSDWVGICLRDKGKAQLNNFNIQGMVLGVSVGEGSELTFSDSKIDRCYQGVSTFYGENDGTVVKISNTDFNFNEDYWTKSYPAISIYGNTQFSYNGGNINNFETGVLLNYNQEESVINNLNPRNL